MFNRITITGLIASLVYIGVILWLISDRLNQVKIMPLNELGDFFAGVFGPLAIFWLILGYLQQGKELRQSTETLKLQAEELRLSVEQQKQLVEVSKKQLEAELEVFKHEKKIEDEASKAKIVFTVRNIENNYDIHDITVYGSNTKSPAHNISIVTEKELRWSPQNLPVWKKDQDHRFRFRFPNRSNGENIKIFISYIDKDGTPRKDIYIMEIKPFISSAGRTQIPEISFYEEKI